jgi:acetyl-CoA carboxylase carboxyl transferase subunit alpha
VVMLEHAVYSVISPEGCASILWRSGEEGREAAAEALKLTAQDLLQLGVVDQVVPEPMGGAHRDKGVAVTALGEALDRTLAGLMNGSNIDFRQDRREKYLEMGKRGLA